LDELVEHDLGQTGIKPIMDLVSQHSWWVSPQVYGDIQIVYPLTRRKRGVREQRGQVIGDVRLWDNQPANHAFWTALGESRHKIKNFNVCHIYEGSVWDPEHFSNLANLVAFPKCLESLSEWRPVKDLLKYHSFKAFDYRGPRGTSPPTPSYYPRTWPHQRDLSQKQLEAIVRRLEEQAKRRPQYKGAE